MPGKRSLAIVTACLNAAGAPDLTLTEVDVTYAEYADGVHCERVEEQLITAGYEEPFLHFDEGQPTRFLVPAVRVGWLANSSPSGERSATSLNMGSWRRVAVVLVLVAGQDAKDVRPDHLEEGVRGQIRVPRVVQGIGEHPAEPDALVELSIRD
jgi:hypothetical protein